MYLPSLVVVRVPPQVDDLYRDLVWAGLGELVDPNPARTRLAHALIC